jgi:hypothetical protein
MFLLDRLLISGLGFVLDKVATVADAELNNEDVVRQRLLEAQMQLDLGEIDEATFVEIERDVLERLREIRRSREEPEPGDMRVTGIDATFEGDEH